MNPNTAPFHLTDEQWQILRPLFPPPPPAGSPGCPPADPRAVLEGILWKLITSSPWHQLPLNTARIFIRLALGKIQLLPGVSAKRAFIF